MSAVITARSLRYSYAAAAPHTVLCDLDLEVEAGEIVLVTGASGAGKTTLLTLCGALRSVQQGELNVLGRNLAALDPTAQRELRCSIGFIFQAHHLLDALTAGQNVVMSLVHRVPMRAAIERAERALNELGLNARIDALPAALSGGEKQRVAVARALVREPQLLLADEPTASLDDHSASIVKGAISSAAKSRSCAVLIVTHDARLFDIADRILRLVDGKLIDSNHWHAPSSLKWMATRPQVETA